MPTLYRITNIREAPGLNDAGQLVTMKIVSYQTANGDTGTIQVPKDMYSAEGVEEAIKEEVAINDRLRGLK